MNILVTGAGGFIGKNLISSLSVNDSYNIIPVTVDSTKDQIDEYCQIANFIFHLAGVNRSNDESHFMTGNCGFTEDLVASLKKHSNKAPIVYTSSIQATNDSIYGKSKKAAEEILLNYKSDKDVDVYIFRLPNVFGKWCKPNYNSVVATFCHNITRDIPIQINDKSASVSLVYVDDVVRMFMEKIENYKSTDNIYCDVNPVHQITVGELADEIRNFKSMRQTLDVPLLSNSFLNKLYATYLSYIPKEKLNYELKMNNDSRGSFTEFVKTYEKGQFSINVSKSGITKGNHWHQTKNEKFLVVSGTGVIRLRSIYSNEVTEYYVDGSKLEVIDIPPGYTHNISNIGENDLVTVMWVNECFDDKRPDTYYMEV